MSNNSVLYSCRGHLSTDISTIKHQVRLFGTLYGKRCILLPLPGKIHKNFCVLSSFSTANNCFSRNITVYTRTHAGLSRQHHAYPDRGRPVIFGLVNRFFSFHTENLLFLYISIPVFDHRYQRDCPADPIGFGMSGKLHKIQCPLLGGNYLKTFFSDPCFC